MHKTLEIYQKKCYNDIRGTMCVLKCENLNFYIKGNNENGKNLH